MRFRFETPVTVWLHKLFSLERVSKWFGSLGLDVTYPAVAVARLVVAEERRVTGETVFLVLFEYADPLGSQLGWRVEPVSWCFPSRAETVLWLKAVAEETPSALFGWGLELLPIFIDLF